MFRVLNLLLHGLHLAIIIFSLLGWCFETCRPYHLILSAGIGLSWFAYGFAIGEPGCCIVTQMQKKLWRKMQLSNMPESYIVNLLEKLGAKACDPRRVDLITQLSFYGTTLVSLVLFFTTPQ